MSLLDVKKHVLRKLAGTEENVKVKIVLPLLSGMGWDLIEDCYFEELAADIYVEHKGRPALIVETKGWEQDFHYGQGLEYSVKLGTPWIVFSSGRRTEVHHALVIRDNLLKPQPLLEYSFESLSQRPQALAHYLSRQAFLDGFEALKVECRPLLAEPLRSSDPSEWEKAFKALAQQVDFRTDRQERMSIEELEQAVSELPPEPQTAYRELMAGLAALAEKSQRLRYARSGLAFNLEAVDKKREMVGRLKWLGLFSVFPKGRTISKGLMNWTALGLTADHLNSLKRLRAPKDPTEAAGIIEVVGSCLREIGLS